MVKDCGNVAGIVMHSGQSKEAVEAILNTLPKIAARALRDNCVFKLSGIIKLKRKWMPERASTTKIICGRSVVLPYLRPRIDVKCLPEGMLVEACTNDCDAKRDMVSAAAEHGWQLKEKMVLC